MNYPHLIASNRSVKQTNSIASNNYLSPTISHTPPKKTALTFEAIVQFYFLLPGLSEADLLQFMPVLTFAEVAIYEIDEEYKIHINDPNFVSQHLPILQNVLIELHLWDEALQAELQRGLTYYRLEQQLCSGAAVTEDDIALANRCQCFACRFLSRLLLKLAARPYEEELLELFWLAESIADVENGLVHYREDVRRNAYNSYRMFLRRYGIAAPQHLRRYLQDLYDRAERRLAGLEATQPHLAARLRSLWATDRGACTIPEIPDPILEAVEAN